MRQIPGLSTGKDRGLQLRLPKETKIRKKDQAQSAGPEQNAHARFWFWGSFDGDLGPACDIETWNLISRATPRRSCVASKITTAVNLSGHGLYGVSGLL